jgi:hypothetical protein
LRTLFFFFKKCVEKRVLSHLIHFDFFFAPLVWPHPTIGPWARTKQIPVDAFRACLVPYYVLVCNYHEAAIVTRVAEKVFQRLLVKYAEHDDEDDSAVAAPSVDLFHEIAHAAKLMFEARAGSDEMMGRPTKWPLIDGEYLKSLCILHHAQNTLGRVLA